MAFSPRRNGDPVSVEPITEAGQQIGQMLTGIASLFNPPLLGIAVSPQ